MPTVTPTPIVAFAHCPHPWCEGGQQEQVDAVRVETAVSFAETGGSGSIPGIENSYVVLTYADESVAACPGCGTRRELSDTARPQYDNLSGFAQDYLANQNAKRFDPARQHAVQDERVHELEAQVADMASRMDRLLAKLDEKD